MDFEIIRADITHAYEMGYVGALSWHAAYRGIVPNDHLAGITPENRAEHLRKLIGVRPEEYYLVRVGGQPAGMTILGKSLDEDTGNATGEIGAIYFLPEYWGKGYGGKTMQFAIDRLKTLGYAAVTLWVFADNTQARAYYERFGYILDGAQKAMAYGEKTLDVVRYRRTIP